MQNKKTTLITGATSGIGRAFADALAARGYDLILTGRRQALLEETADALRARHGALVTALLAELSDERDIRRLEALIRSTDIDLLVNNAGFGLRGCGSHVRVQALCPGLTRTDFQLKMGMPKEKQKNRGVMRWQEPEAVVTRSLRFLEHNRPMCVCGGAMGAAETMLSALLPRRLYYLLALRLFPVPPQPVQL